MQKQRQVQINVSHSEREQLKRLCREQDWQKTTGALSIGKTVKELVRGILRLRRNAHVEKYLNRTGKTLMGLIETAVLDTIRKR